jgi:hypothetical protein
MGEAEVLRVASSAGAARSRVGTYQNAVPTGTGGKVRRVHASRPLKDVISILEKRI